MRPKLVALLAVSAFALVGCAAPTQSLSDNEKAYLDTVSGILQPFSESTDAVSQNDLLEAGYKSCKGELVPVFEQAGHYKFAVSNVVITSSNELCPNK